MGKNSVEQPKADQISDSSVDAGQVARAKLLIPQFSGSFPHEIRHGTTRRQQGNHHCACVIRYWLAKNEWSHPDVVYAANWALGELPDEQNKNGAVHESQISQLRQNNVRMWGLKVLDGFGALNLAVWAFHNDRSLLVHMNTAEMTAKAEKLLARAEPIMNPHNGLPMTQGDWMMLFMGHISVDGIPTIDTDSDQYKAVLPLVGGYVASVIASNGISAAVAMERIKEIIPQEQVRKRLGMAMLGLHVYSPQEFENDISDIARALTVFEGQTVTVNDLMQMIQNDAMKTSPGQP